MHINHSVAESVQNRTSQDFPECKNDEIYPAVFRFDRTETIYHRLQCADPLQMRVTIAINQAPGNRDHAGGNSIFRGKLQ